MQPIVKEFEFDGTSFRSGKMRFDAPPDASVDGVDFKIPSRFALLLLSSSKCAWELLDSVAKAPLGEEVKVRLLKKAASEGVERARVLMNAYLREAPNGRPRFYREDSDSNCAVYLTDGRVCLRFGARVDLRPLIKDLPPNVYCRHEATRFSLDLLRFNQASAEIDEFFSFTTRLSRASRHIAGRTLESCFYEYFRDKGHAYDLLLKIEKDSAYRSERQAVFERLVKEKVLKFQGGFLVEGWGDVYCVTEEGGVYKLDYRSRDDMRNAILRAVKSGVAPKKAVEVNDPEELSCVARIVGKVCPQLVPVIIP